MANNEKKDGNVFGGAVKTAERSDPGSVKFYRDNCAFFRNTEDGKGACDHS